MQSFTKLFLSEMVKVLCITMFILLCHTRKKIKLNHFLFLVHYILTFALRVSVRKDMGLIMDNKV